MHAAGRQPEVAIATYHHTVGENSLGLKKMMYCVLNSTTNLTLTPKKKVTICMMTHKQIQQMFCEESDDDELLGFELILLIICRFWCILYAG